jgi:hypothetical protein
VAGHVTLFKQRVMPRLAITSLNLASLKDEQSLKDGEGERGEKEKID